MTELTQLSSDTMHVLDVSTATMSVSTQAVVVLTHRRTVSTCSPIVLTRQACEISRMPKVSASRTPAELASAVQRAIADLDALDEDLGIVVPKLSPSMKRHTARYRKGGEKLIAILGNLARQQGVDFPSSPVSEMTEQLAIANALEALTMRVTVLQTHLGNAVFSARASAWQSAMQYYALLRRMARSNRELAAALEPVKQYMSMHDPRGKKVVGEPSRRTERAVKKAQKVVARYPEAAAEMVARKKKSGG